MTAQEGIHRNTHLGTPQIQPWHVEPYAPPQGEIFYAVRCSNYPRCDKIIITRDALMVVDIPCSCGGRIENSPVDL